ncbi:MAG: hypothetical protein EOO48_14120 [Flavobacterium sp.]|nr:MAG: hypothetical protein EOO48_14120 [Flavobacterium sp.]
MIRIIVFIFLLSSFLAQPAFAQNPKPRKKPSTTSNTFSPPKSEAKPAKLKKRDITPTIEVALPANFKAMSLDEIADEYPTWKKPLAAYTDPQGHADFIVTERKSDFPAKDMVLLQQFYKASIQNMFSEVEFLSEKIQKVNGRDYLLMEFTSMVKHEDKDFSALKKPVRKYNYIMYTVDDAQKKMTIFTLQTPIEFKKTWEEVAPDIMTSVRLKAPKTDPAQQKPQTTIGK